MILPFSGACPFGDWPNAAKLAPINSVVKLKNIAQCRFVGLRIEIRAIQPGERAVLAPIGRNFLREKNK
jgi:hypothetical protein